MVDSISALGLIVTATKEIAESIKRTRGTSKKQFLTQIVRLFDIFDEIDEQINNINSNLRSFLDEQQIGMRVHYIHSAGLHLEIFKRKQEDFFEWMRKNNHIQQGIKIFYAEKSAAKSASAFERLVFEHGTLSGSRIITDAIETTRDRLQATKSPNPAQFPEQKMVEEVIKIFTSLHREISRAKKEISSFVSTNFNIQDLFD